MWAFIFIRMKTLLIIYVGLAVQGSALSQDTLKVLFVGNSYTYFWNLPQVVEAMAESRNFPLITRQSTAGGANLGHHSRGARNLNTVSMVDSGDWDHVILQDHSLRAIQAPDSLHYYVNWWNQRIQNSGDTTHLYMTWARNFNPLMILTIAEEYESVGNDLSIPVVPIGRIWDSAKRLRPEIDLYDPDGSHPSPLGTYLTACAFFSHLSGQSSVGFPARLVSTDQNGEKLYLTIVPPSDAAFCQDVVEQLLGNE